MKRFLLTLLFSSFAGSLLAPLALAASGDLSLHSESVWFQNEYLLEGQYTRIWATVQNNSNADLLGSVRFSTQFGAIGPDQPVSALKGKTDDVFIDWAPTSAGTFTITVTVYPLDPSQDDGSNNTVTKTVTVAQDSDFDGITNSEDEDLDGDGVKNEEDLFPNNKDESADTDGDGQGNNKDEDDDNDNVSDSEDQLPLDPNHSRDQDQDGLADEVDEDLDGDGISNEDEETQSLDPRSPDTDGDGISDGEDAFPQDSDESKDTDQDGIGDLSDEDLDGDGLANEEDSAPDDSAPSANPNHTIYLTSLGDTVTFDASSSQDPDGNIVSYVWNFGEEIAEGLSTEKTFDSRGLQVATLTVTDDAGQSDTAEIKIRVIDLKFVWGAILFALILILLAFYTIDRYNRPKKSRKKS